MLYMTKNELKRLIVEVYSEMNEGAISAQEMTDSVIEVIKNTIKSLSRQINGLNRKYIGVGNEQIQFVADVINKDIDEKLVKTKLIPCVVEFVMMDEDDSSNSISLGAYSFKIKKIKLNSLKYLTIKRDDNYELRDIKNINFDAIYDTIEHELIHQQQDARSKGKINRSEKWMIYLTRKYDSDGDGILDDNDIKMITPEDFKIAKSIQKKEKFKNYKDYKPIFDKKKIIAPKLNDDEFIGWIEYYNDKMELNPYAKDTVNKYVTRMFKEMKLLIKSGTIENREHNSNEVRNFILSPILDYSGADMFELPKTDSSKVDTVNWYKRNVKIMFKGRMIANHVGYKYLTVDNKKKWWRYVFHLLLNYKFEPIILKK